MTWDPHSDVEHPTEQGPQLDSNQLIAVCKSLYRECADDLGIDVSNLNNLTMKMFVEWCVENNMPLAREDEFTKTLSLLPDCCKVIDELFRGDAWQCASLLMPIWFIVALQHRPPVENGIAFTHVSFTIGFRDHKVMQIAVPQQMAPGITNTDGYLLSLMESQANSMLQRMAHIGIDVLHDEYAQPVVDDPAQLERKDIPPAPPGKIGWS